MKYTLNGQQIDFDESLIYHDFYLVEGRPKALCIDWAAILYELQSGQLPWEEVKQPIRELSRWVHEAPRKRFFRDQILAGFTVLSTENFFADENGRAFINGLENSGRIAAAICEAFGVEPMRPLRNDSLSPIPGDDLHKYET